MGQSRYHHAWLTLQKKQRDCEGLKDPRLFPPSNAIEVREIKCWNDTKTNNKSDGVMMKVLSARHSGYTSVVLLTIIWSSRDEEGKDLRYFTHSRTDAQNQGSYAVQRILATWLEWYDSLKKNCFIAKLCMLYSIFSSKNLPMFYNEGSKPMELYCTQYYYLWAGLTVAMQQATVMHGSHFVPQGQTH